LSGASQRGSTVQAEAAGAAGVPAPAHRLSVVVPFYDEAQNVALQVERIHAGLADYRWPWELVLVDDGSRDATLGELRAARERHGHHVRVIALARNFGQTAALRAGLDAARGDVVATLDGDLQNEPADIPRLVDELFARDLDLLVGWRRERRDGFVLRRLPSQLANRLIARITGVRLHDYGCGLKLFRASLLQRIRLYGEMHRFIPAWAATATTAERIGESVVTHHARRHGRSKYGLDRTFKVLLDLMAVFFFMRYRAKPVHFFGAIGLSCGALGTIALGYLAWVKFVQGEDIGQRPLLLVGVVLVLASLQFITTGIVTELIARTYFESARVLPYLRRVEAEPEAELDPAAGWSRTRTDHEHD
jgi:glycosyltransferase involved in cell wall biosynthesis